MNEGLIPRRYAKALYEVAVERNQAERLYRLMKCLEQQFEASPALEATLANPFVSDSDKIALLRTAAGAIDADTAYNDFLKLLAQNRRLDFAPGICRAYTLLYRQTRDIYRVHVVSAAPLSQDQETRLKKFIESHLKGASMEYSSAVDPQLIGGFVVNVDNERLDASVRQQLQQMRQHLIQ